MKINICTFYDLAIISKYRSQLMGLAAIAILLCHAPANIKSLPSSLSIILSSLGMFGNSIFFFLSGIGIWYSLYNKVYPFLLWYKKRFLRLFLPYLIVSLFIQVLLVIVNNSDWIDVIKYITGISFFLHGNGPWFVWALVPLYILSPLIFLLYRKKYSVLFLFGTCLITQLPNLFSCQNNQIVFVLQQLFANAPCFLFGIWLAPYVKLGYKINIFHTTCFFLIILCLRFICGLSWLSFVNYAVYPSVIIATIIVEKIINLNKILTFFGSISLESYLFNTSLPGVFRCMACLSIIEYESICYILVLFSGTLLSIFVHWCVSYKLNTNGKT